ncbi:MspA family porin [Mycolicibacterium rufum]|uniref:MspA family porin n=1 Tax=Mycolicibacterium rufum TaxID=318424 RepID=A0A9X2YB40_9MYCO|nr:MspA family porin [Mycolicibacterium rufum]MCV7069988.1 MspA family porin [Mycolicibacterium rufum]ULP35285.1 MspA family porin [Mycolicibacterium rufum]
MRLSFLALPAGWLLLGALWSPVATAQPDAGPVTPAEPVAAAAAVPAAPPVDAPPEGAVVSPPPATTTSPDGWTLTVGAKDETQKIIAPLTTAISSREYEVGGVFNGSLSGPEEATPPRGVLEVGYQIGCGIDMSTSNGVSLTGTAGINPSLGILGTDVISPFPEGVLPGVAGNLGGGITIGLKPGIINMVKVTEKQYTGAEPWVMVHGFRIKIDGCVGESFIRSYAVLTRSTDLSDAVLAYYGETKKV